MQGEATHVSAVGAIRDYKQNGTWNDSCMKYFAPRILLDRYPDDLVDPVFADDAKQEEVFNGLLDARWIERKPPRTATTQWCTYTDGMDYFAPEWHERTIGLLNLGLGQGFAKPEKATKIVKALKVAEIGGAAVVPSAEKETAKSAKGKQQKLMSNFAAAHISLYAMMDGGFYSDTNLVRFVLAPWRLLHGRFQKDLSSVKNTKQFHHDMAFRVGAFWETIEESLKPFQKPALLRQIGFVVSTAHIVLDEQGEPDVAVHLEAHLVPG